MIRRIKHTQAELKAMRMLENAINFASNKAAEDILFAAKLCMTYYYPSDRDLLNAAILLSEGRLHRAWFHHE